VYDEAMEQWEATRRVQDIAIPDTLQAVLMARIDRLEEGARRVLQMASVIGRIFRYRVLAAIAEDAKEMRAHLSALQREEMIRERARLPDLEYIFKHHLTQVAAYDGLLRRERRRFHRQVAGALEQLSPDRIEEQLGLLAHHWEQAGEGGRAVEYLRRAGEQAADQYANAEAVGYFNRALDLTPEEDLASRYELLLAREQVCDRQGAREAQTKDLAALEGLALALGDDRKRAEVALRRAHYGIRTSDYPAAVAAAQEAADLARSTGDVYLEASAYLHAGRALHDIPDRDASQHALERALRLSREAGASADLRAEGSGESSRRIEARCLYELAYVCQMQRDFERCTWYAEQALHLSQELGDQETEARAFWMLGIALMLQGDYSAAQTYMQRSLEIHRQLGDRLPVAWRLGTLGEVRHMLGDYDGARPYYEQYLSIVRQTQHARGIRAALNDLTLLSLRLGDAEQALEYAQESLRVDLRGRSYVGLGYALGALGRPDEASQAFQKALGYCREHHQQVRAMECLAGLADISLGQGSLAEAEEHVEEILCHLETGGLDGAWHPARIYLTCYRVLNANEDPRAGDILEEGYRFLQERAAKISDEEDRRSFLENVEEHREIVEEWASHCQTKPIDCIGGNE
jgi:predicted ATPase